MHNFCGLHAYGLIGPYLFKNEAGSNVAVNGKRYRNMIGEYFFRKIHLEFSFQHRHLDYLSTQKTGYPNRLPRFTFCSNIYNY